MDSATPEQELRVKRSHYHKSLVLCFVLSIGICCTVLLNIPSEHDGEPSDIRGDITFITTRCCLTIALVLIEICFLLFIKKRDNFHRRQEIFWPVRCQHCARAIGLLPELRSRLKRSRSLDHLEKGNRGNSDMLRFDKERGQDWRQDILDNVSQKWRHPLYHKPHKSLLNTLYIFGIVIGINILLHWMAYIVCIATTDKSPIVRIAILSQLLLNGTYTVAIFSAMLFFKNYYDAAFLDETKLTLPLAFCFALSSWLAAETEMLPLGEIINSKYATNEYPCKLSGKLGNIVNRNNTILTPFYAEFAIISAAMVWHIWSSIVPRCCLPTTKGTEHLQSLGPRCFGNHRIKLIASFHNIVGRCRSKFISLNSSREERQRLLPTEQKEDCLNAGLLKGVTCTVIGCVILGIVYFSLCQVLEFSDFGLPHRYHEVTLTYLKWFLNMFFYFPLLAMLRYRAVLTVSLTHFKLKRTVSLFTGLIGAHDLIFLTSCVGIFTLNIFRFVSAAGVLLKYSQRPHEEVSLACFAVVFSIFQSYSAWVMTSFLLVVQRQAIRGVDGVKWTLVCLIYTGILNATQWLIDSVEIHVWAELTMFYGHTQGMVIGAFLEPLSSLYGIHSAMIAYESFKSIRSDL